MTERDLSGKQALALRLIADSEPVHWRAVFRSDKYGHPFTTRSLMALGLIEDRYLGPAGAMDEFWQLSDAGRAALEGKES